MDSELGGKSMREFAALDQKHNYLTNDSDEDERKNKRHKKVCQKKNINLKIINIV